MRVYVDGKWHEGLSGEQLREDPKFKRFFETPKNFGVDDLEGLSMDEWARVVRERAGLPDNASIEESIGIINLCLAELQRRGETF